MKIKYWLFVWALILNAVHTQGQKIAGPLQIKPGADNGLTLFAPLNSNNTYLIDNCGRVINTWHSDYLPGNTVYLMENGNLFRTNLLDNTVITGGGGGGGLEILDWDSNQIWSFSINTDLLRQHHDVAVLPNGNVLALVWELRSKDEALAQGRNPGLLADNVVWSERVVEIKPILPDGGEIVWQWSLWDHLIQDFDPSSANYGIVGDHPELVDLNFTATPTGTNDWIHANAIDYNAELNQLVISSPFLDEFWIIDHSTSTAEAASHLGGSSGRGGDLLYRWGNPATYDQGSIADQKLFGQHHVHWIDPDLPHGGEIMVFNNRRGSDYSTVDIMNPQRNEDGAYELTGGRFAPTEQDFTYVADPPSFLYSSIMSSAEVLPNGNLLICSALQGRIYEVNASQEILWEYISPVTTVGIVGRDLPADQSFRSDRIFRAKKYSTNYAGFAGRNLLPGEPIEGEPWACELITANEKEQPQDLVLFPNPVHGDLRVKASDPGRQISAKLCTVQGQQIASGSGVGEISVDVSAIHNGLYIVFVNNTSYKIIKKD